MCGEVLLQLEKTQQCPGAATFQAVYLASITCEDVTSSLYPAKCSPNPLLPYVDTQVLTRERQQAFIQRWDNTASQNHALEGDGKLWLEQPRLASEPSIFPDPAAVFQTMLQQTHIPAAELTVHHSTYCVFERLQMLSTHCTGDRTPHMQSIFLTLLR